MIKIASIGGKGGITKTTCAITIAAGAAIRGYRVVIVDADPQCHVAQSLGMEKEEGLYELLVNDAQWGDQLRIPERKRWAGENSAHDRLFVLPGSTMTGNIRRDTDNDEGLLMERVREDDALERAGINMMIFDCNASINGIANYVLLAVDYIILPTVCENLSQNGLATILQQLRATERRRRRYGLNPLKVIGIQPNMHRRRVTLHQQHLEWMQKRFGSIVWEPIDNRAAWAYASENQRSIFSYAPGKDIEDQAWGLVDNVLGVFRAKA